MMYGELYHYFTTYRQLNVPGIGTFLLNRQPASADFVNRQILPPVYSVSLEQGAGTASRHFINWLAATLNITDRDAVIRFNDFAFEVKRKLQAGEKIDWNGIGTLKTGLGTEIKFDPETIEPVFDKSIAAEKVVRSQAEHTVRVGEDEKTAAQMREYFSHQDTEKVHWWAWALIIGIATTLFCGWYFSANGLKISSSGNRQKTNPEVSSPTYQSIP